jgi:hypothetical protein
VRWRGGLGGCGGDADGEGERRDQKLY